MKFGIICNKKAEFFNQFRLVFIEKIIMESLRDNFRIREPVREKRDATVTDRFNHRDTEIFLFCRADNYCPLYKPFAVFFSGCLITVSDHPVLITFLGRNKFFWDHLKVFSEQSEAEIQTPFQHSIKSIKEILGIFIKLPSVIPDD